MYPHQATSYGDLIPGSEFIRSLARQGTISPTAAVRLRWIDFHRSCQNIRLTCRHFAISPGTFYKWFNRFDPYDLTTLENVSKRPHHVRQTQTPPDIVEKVRALRKRYPRWGKDKLAVLLRREKIVISGSTVGRVMNKLRARGLLVEPENIRQAKLARKRRQKPRYAARKPRDFQAHHPGDLLEIDTLQVRICPNEIRFQFGAVDIVSRFQALRVYRRQTSTAGADFLHYLRKKFPYPVRAIQIDGGSEFKDQFEAACQKLKLPLYVNPPRCPELNGHIERANRTSREEFYEVQDLEMSVEGLNRQLDQYAYEFNYIRPHQALDYLTPHAFFLQWKRSHKAKEVSTMS
jgi:transposase InsO family protein